MERNQKESFISKYAERLENAKIAILADFRGVSVDQINTFRTKVRNAEGIEFRVGKNRLFKRVFDGTPWEALNDHLIGPTGILLGDEDIVEVAKLADDFASHNDHFEIKVAFAEGKVIDAAGVAALAKMPSKDQLRAQFLSVLQAVPRTFVSLMQAPSRNFVSLMENFRKKQAGED